MMRGTTPTEIYKINSTKVDLSACKQIWVTIVDWDCMEYSWGIDRLDIDAENDTVSLTLTQAETLAFVPGRAYAQLRFLHNNDKAFGSKRICFDIEDIKKGGEIR